MRYYIDTEFLEGTQKENFPISLFRKNTPPTIDLISIGIVAEDGREYYAISKDFNLKEAWNRFDLEIQSGDMRNVFPEGRKIYWIRENVLKPIWRELFFQADDCSGLSNKQTEAFHKGVFAGEYDHWFTFKSMKLLISKYGKTNEEIANEVKEFCHFWKTLDSGRSLQNHPIEFYAYYADYDWVGFCWLFGKMMDLPKGFPMYCKDLKQVLDENEMLVEGYSLNLKNHTNFPKQDPSKAHNALEDARWNKQLHEFLSNL